MAPAGSAFPGTTAALRWALQSVPAGGGAVGADAGRALYRLGRRGGGKPGAGSVAGQTGGRRSKDMGEQVGAPGDDGAEDGEDEDIAGDERREGAVEAGAGGHGGQDRRELAACQEGGGDSRGGLGAVVVEAGDEQSAATLMTMVRAAAAATGVATEAMSPGSMASPKAKKKMAAKASRNGCTSSRIRGPEGVPARISPTRKAPMASATPRTSETPAMRTAAPRKLMTSSSLSRTVISRPIRQVP